MLEAKQVGYYYDKRKKVLDGISLELERGKFYVISGQSGCGKTTLLSLLGGLDEPKEGVILCEGENISEKGLSYHRKNHVAFVFQKVCNLHYLSPQLHTVLPSQTQTNKSTHFLSIIA